MTFDRHRELIDRVGTTQAAKGAFLASAPARGECWPQGSSARRDARRSASTAEARNEDV
jgi:hypothetical protein